MKDEDLKIQRRLQSLFEKLGANPKCIVCGHDNPFGLKLHHIAGQGYGEQTVTVCRKCGPELTKRQELHPEPKGQPPSDFERSARYLLGRADLCDLWAARVRKSARTLFELDHQSSPNNGTSSDKSGTLD
jgi:hypothetical protein